MHEFLLELTSHYYMLNFAPLALQPISLAVSKDQSAGFRLFSTELLQAQAAFLSDS